MLPEVVTMFQYLYDNVISTGMMTKIVHKHEINGHMSNNWGKVKAINSSQTLEL